ncbi:class I adenylate-forming enzyme family protein [Aeromonas sp. 75A]|uniref:class I adenylate-forming enzyme family protein n=1 Tax=unclassified Aeromonas TaxID=257493 RepID=UPI002E7B3D5E|nr:class I adenylate-forming enzyme family protein [Aeromonas sp. 43P]MEE1953903.1 class I adenylate-forming enzyme family protein [Aeromonas sp. 43P]
MKSMQNKNVNSLLAFLKLVPGERPFLVNNSINLTYADIVDFSEKKLIEYGFCAGKNIAVSFESRALACQILPSLSELAKNLLIIPSGLNDEVVNSFFDKANIEYIFRCMDDGIEINKLTEFAETDSDNTTRNGNWILATSGTTGKPKLVSYGLQQLTNSTKTDLSKGPLYNWALIYDVNRFAGLQVYFQALMSGSKLTVLEQADSLESVIDVLVQTNVNCLSATPSFFRKLLMNPRCDSIDLKRITLGGEIADQTILNSLSRLYPLSKISHIYASTEAGVGFVVKDAKEGFPLNYIDNKTLLSTSTSTSTSTSLKIKNETLWIKSASTAESIVSGTFEFDEFGYINTGDLVCIKGDRVLFLGRESGTINVGGNKVIPEEIENVLLTHPLISECRVFGKASSMMGMLVACDVVIIDPRLASSDLKKSIQEYTKKYLDSFKIPVLIKFVNEIEKNSVGKIKRNLAS